MLNLPEYRLGELTYIWKALQSVKPMAVKFASKQDFSTGILHRLHKLGLQHFNVRKLVLLRFTCLNQDSERNDQLSSSSKGYTRGQDSNAEPNSEADQSAYAFVIATRRSRTRDRILFYAKDTLVYAGFKWGFSRTTSKSNCSTLKMRW